MALGFIKKIFSFGKDDKGASAPEPEVSPDAAPLADGTEQPAEAPIAEALPGELPAAVEPVLDPVTIDEIGERLIIPDDLEQSRHDPAEELREQAESVAEFNEAVEEEPAEQAAAEEPVAGIAPGVVEAAGEMETGGEAEPVAEPEVADGAPAVEPERMAEAGPEQAGDAVSSVAAAPADEPDMPVAEDAVAESGEPVDEAAPAPEPGPEPMPEPGPVAEDSAPEQAPAETPKPAPVLPAGFSSTAGRVEPAPMAPERRLSWIERLRQGLSRTSAQLTTQITSLFTKRKLDDDTLQDLEDLLIQADLGVETAMRITDTLASERYGKDVSGEDVSKIMAAEIAKVLDPVAKPLELDLAHKPHVILVVGVNGTGKTTTIGKLAAKLTRGGLKVMLAAGDTFRAAAIEQLHIWAERTGADIVSSKLGADAAGLAYEAYEKAKQAGHDVLIIDTAGRLQNKTELMAELEKIVRVLGRLDPDAPHTVLQTLDATTGQNALNQVEIFRNVAGVSGLIMTKLDGTARGGILVAISARHKLPVCFIGVGEGIDDLEPFNARDFAEAIAGIQNK